MLAKLRFTVTNGSNSTPVVGAKIILKKTTGNGCVASQNATLTTNSNGITSISYQNCNTGCTLIQDYSVNVSGFNPSEGQINQPCASFINVPVVLTPQGVPPCTQDSDCGAGECCNNGVCGSCPPPTINYMPYIVIISIVIILAIIAFFLHII